MPRVDLDTYTPPAPALIEHGKSSSVAMRATASPSHTPNRLGRFQGRVGFLPGVLSWSGPWWPDRCAVWSLS